MEFDLVDIEELSGNKAHIYSILLDGEEDTLLDKFFSENEDFADELSEIHNQLFSMGHRFGCREQLFKLYEGKPGDGVVAIRQGQLRLYCLRYGNAAIFVGSGGYKPPEIHAYQEDPVLNSKAQQMIKIANAINQAIKDRDIKVNDDGSLTLSDNLELLYE